MPGLGCPYMRGFTSDQQHFVCGRSLELRPVARSRIGGSGTGSCNGEFLRLAPQPRFLLVNSVIQSFLNKALQKVNGLKHGFLKANTKQRPDKKPYDQSQSLTFILRFTLLILPKSLSLKFYFADLNITSYRPFAKEWLATQSSCLAEKKHTYQSLHAFAGSCCRTIGLSNSLAS